MSKYALSFTENFDMKCCGSVLLFYELGRVRVANLTFDTDHRIHWFAVLQRRQERNILPQCQLGKGHHQAVSPLRPGSGLPRWLHYQRESQIFLNVEAFYEFDHLIHSWVCTQLVHSVPDI